MKKGRRRGGTKVKGVKRDIERNKEMRGRGVKERGY